MADTPHPPFDNPPPEGQDEGKHVAKLWMVLSGASAHDYHDEMPGVDPKAMNVGHEPDQFNAKTIIYVPIAVAIALVVTYLIVQGAFSFVNGTASRQDEEVRTESADPAEIDRLKKENQDKVRPPNERAARLRQWTPEPLKANAPTDKPAAAKPQANLEYMQQKDYSRLDVNGNRVYDKPFVRSTPAAGNNSPEYYPEDLRPENYADPFHGNAQLLAEPTWVVKDKLATVPVREMIHLVAHDTEWKKLLKVAEKKATLHPGTVGKPKLSTGGVTAPLPGAVEKKDDHDDHK